jgi:crossover junction endodeoxyribonuclease RuvC
VDEQGSVFKHVASGCILTGQELPAEARLELIFNQLNELLRVYCPRTIALEKIFFNKNIRTALQVGEARGVVILAAALSRVDLFEYTPLQVKQAVTGFGKAEKRQVKQMVQLLLELKQKLTVDDEADALAVALCHLQHRRWNEAIKGGGKV